MKKGKKYVKSAETRIVIQGVNFYMAMEGKAGFLMFVFFFQILQRYESHPCGFAASGNLA